MEEMMGEGGEGTPSIQQVLGSVTDIIYNFMQVEQFFAFLTLAWYGSRLIAEDRRLSANLLYFARPITPLRYILGKFGTAGAFGLLTLLAPALLICAQAAISSPDWAFLKDSPGVIVAVLWYGMLWMVCMSSVILAISSCFKRRSFALVCSFVLIFLTHGISSVVIAVTEVANYGLGSLLQNLQTISRWAFYEGNIITKMAEQQSGMNNDLDTSIPLTFLSLGIMTVLSWIVLYRNVKRMEVIA
jgi:ABC-type transport system involved in multi-copper enzyme maturation permease subunit